MTPCSSREFVTRGHGWSSRFETERVPNPEDSENENEEVKWKVEYIAYTALVAVNEKTIFFLNCFRY